MMCSNGYPPSGGEIHRPLGVETCKGSFHDVMEKTCASELRDVHVSELEFMLVFFPHAHYMSLPSFTF